MSCVFETKAMFTWSMHWSCCTGNHCGGGEEKADVNTYPAVFIKNIILPCIIVLSRPHILQGGRRGVDVLLHIHKRPSEKAQGVIRHAKSTSCRLEWVAESLTFWPQVAVFGHAGLLLSRFWNSFRNWRQNATQLVSSLTGDGSVDGPHGGFRRDLGDNRFFWGVTKGQWLIHVVGVTSAGWWLWGRKRGKLKDKGKADRVI